MNGANNFSGTWLFISHFIFPPRRDVLSEQPITEIALIACFVQMETVIVQVHILRLRRQEHSHRDRFRAQLVSSAVDFIPRWIPMWMRNAQMPQAFFTILTDKNLQSPVTVHFGFVALFRQTRITHIFKAHPSPPPGRLETSSLFLNAIRTNASSMALFLACDSSIMSMVPPSRRMSFCTIHRKPYAPLL